MKAFRAWLYQVVIAFDQLVNAIFGGMADETISARSYRLNYRYPYKVYEKFINAVFYPFQGPDHCYYAYLKEFNGMQRPPEKQ